jgi:hypothetical protein
MSAFLFSQILIGIAFLFDLASFQFKKREITVILFAVSAVLISTHFFLLGAYSAGFVIAVSAVRHFISAFTTDKKLKYVFLFLIGVLGIYTFDGFEDIFSILSGILGTFAVFQSDEKKLRVIMIGAILAIIVHNILIWTPAGIALETFFLGSNLVSYYRFFWKKHE